MKKVLLPIALFAILLSMSNCDNEPISTTALGGDISLMNEPENPLLGEWVHENSGERYVITEIDMTVFWNDGRIYFTGDYIYDDYNITINVDLEKSIYTLEKVIYPYIRSGDILFLMGVPLTMATQSN